MFAFACIAGGLIVACTVFALLVPSGPEVTLSDIARQLETIHRSQPITSSGMACLKTGAKLESVNSKEESAQPGNPKTVIEQRSRSVSALNTVTCCKAHRRD
jgi:hypothetical protein